MKSVILKALEHPTMSLPFIPGEFSAKDDGGLPVGSNASTSSVVAPLSRTMAMHTTYLPASTCKRREIFLMSAPIIAHDELWPNEGTVEEPTG